VHVLFRMNSERPVTADVTIFRHARWRVLILGMAGVGLGLVVLSQSWGMLDPAWHTDAGRLAQLCASGSSDVISVGALLLTIGIVNVWVVLQQSPALILDPERITALRVLQRRLTVPWREIMRIEHGKGRHASSEERKAACHWLRLVQCSAARAALCCGRAVAGGAGKRSMNPNSAGGRFPRVRRGARAVGLSSHPIPR
jgi:hypothetical protein